MHLFWLACYLFYSGEIKNNNTLVKFLFLAFIQNWTDQTAEMSAGVLSLVTVYSSSLFGKWVSESLAERLQLFA